MRIWVLSDLHLEVEDLNFRLEIPRADVCIMAGDLTRPIVNGVRWLAERILPYMPCVYVPGNHEYYRSSIHEGWRDGAAEARLHDGLHLLNDDLTVIDGVRFLGSTLWTDYRLMGNQGLAMQHARDSMNDHRAIDLRKSPWERFLPKHAFERHEASRRFLADAMAIPFDGATVVVTHHCPLMESVHETYRGDLLNAAFSSDLSREIESGRPSLWVHGHTHFSFDYRFGDTRVLCNPRGYGTENREFRRNLVVEVESPNPKLLTG